jgi:hypothetical protein
MHAKKKRKEKKKKGRNETQRRLIIKREGTLTCAGSPATAA